MDSSVAANLKVFQRYPGNLFDGAESARNQGISIVAQMDRSSPSGDFFAVHDEVCNALEEAIDSALLRYRPALLTALQYIQTHISEDLPISRVAKVVGYHPKYFSRVFKGEIGRSYTEFINSMRIHTAQRMLQETSLSLTEICESCGFNEIPYFCYKFKQYTGFTAKQWREQK